MHNKKIMGKCRLFLEYGIGLLSGFFWILVLFGFDKPRGALLTLLAIAIHEAGHLAAFAAIGKLSALPRPRAVGFSLGTPSHLSYKEDIIVSAAGPLANLLTAALLLVTLGEPCELAVINLLTAVSNLLPVKGYDGYRMLSAILAVLGVGSGLARLPDRLSFATATLAVFISLYSIRTFDTGYWIFGVFFIFLLGEVKNSL